MIMQTLVDKAKSATDIAYTELKRAVLTCELAPGSFLTEIQLTESTGHGRGAIREALARLTRDGLVEVHPRRGYRITNVSLTDVREVFEMRLFLEPEAAALAAERASREDIERLRDFAHAHFTPGDEASYIAYVESHRAFLAALATLSGNNRLAAATTQLLEAMQRVQFLSRPGRQHPASTANEYDELFTAVFEGDPERARVASARHIENARARIIQTLV